MSIACLCQSSHRLLNELSELNNVIDIYVALL
jgi:hypothetical protein